MDTCPICCTTTSPSGCVRPAPVPRATRPERTLRAVVHSWGDLMAWSRCRNCNNVGQLYIRRTKVVCIDCATLNPSWSRVGSTRHTSAVDHPNFLSPVNQPNALNGPGDAEPCVYCHAVTFSRYRTQGGAKFAACSWGHAGFYLDAVDSMETREAQDAAALIEGEAYVRASLGLEER